jgi:periplasmic protein TonB
MGTRLFEGVGLSAVAERRAFAWPVSAGIHLAAAAAVVAASAVAGVELPAPPVIRGVICLPAAPDPTTAAAPPPRKGIPLPHRPLVVGPPPVAHADEGPPLPAERPRDVLPSSATDGEGRPGPGGGHACDGCRPDGDPNGVPGATGTGGGGRAVRPPLRISAGIEPPRKLRGAAPVYPALAISVRAEGRVVVECVIGEDGRVSDVRVVRGHPLLADAAAAAVRQWHYAPTLLNGEPVAVIMTVTVDFRLAR